MSNSVNKDQLNAELEKAKAVGAARLERVRDILRDAMSQVMAEVKEGTSELRSIAKESTSAMRQPQQATQPDVAPIEVTIEDSELTPDPSLTSDLKSDETVVEAVVASTLDPALADELKPQMAIVDAPTGSPVDASVELPATDHAEAPLDATVPAADQPAISTTDLSMTDIELAQPAADSTEAATNSWLQQLQQLLQESGVGAKLHQQGTKLQEQLVQIDQTLSERYGDRYATLKKELIAAKAWYNDKRAEATARGIDPVQQKQAEYDVKVGEAGATIARKEQEIKRLLKELWQTVTKF